MRKPINPPGGTRNLSGSMVCAKYSRPSSMIAQMICPQRSGEKFAQHSVTRSQLRQVYISCNLMRYSQLSPNKAHSIAQKVPMQVLRLMKVSGGVGGVFRHRERASASEMLALDCSSASSRNRAASHSSPGQLRQSRIDIPLSVDA